MTTLTASYADDRAQFTSEHDERYALGDPADPLLVLNAVDDFGCIWVADVPDGWDAPSVDTPMDRRQDGHGGYAGEPTFGERVLTWEGTVTAPSSAALRAAHRRWLDAVLGGIPSFTRYTHLDEDPARGLWLLPHGQPRWRAFDDRAADFSFVMVAEDPIKTGATVTSPIVRVATSSDEGGYAVAGGGLTMPVTAAGAGLARIVVALLPNGGDESSHAVYDVVGPIEQPIVRLGTGEYARVNVTLTALDHLVIDTAAGSVQVNGVNRYDAWAGGSTFPLIPPGGAEVRLQSGTGTADPALAGLTATTASSWK